MIAEGDVLTGTNHSMKLAKLDALVVVFEATYAPGAKAPPLHRHPAQEEVIEILEGSLKARIAGVERILTAGEKVTIAAGVDHTMGNPFAEPARTRWETRPPLRTAEFFARLHHEGGHPLAMLALVAEYRDVFELSVAPAWLLRPLLLMLAWLARRLGLSRPG